MPPALPATAAEAARAVTDAGREATRRDPAGFWRSFTTVGIVAVLAWLALSIVREVRAGGTPSIAACPPVVDPLETRVRALETVNARNGALLEAIQRDVVEIKSRLK